jgi:CcmD family protein
MTPLVVVLIVVLLIWSGIFGYLLHLDKQIKYLRDMLKKNK